jgi:hypothetical protein
MDDNPHCLMGLLRRKMKRFAHRALSTESLKEQVPLLPAARQRKLNIPSSTFTPFMLDSSLLLHINL